MTDTPEMNEAGFALLRLREGCILYAYDDANDKAINPGDTVYGTLTIGYGHTGSDVVPGLTWTQDQAEQALQNDVDAFSGQISKLITAKLTANQFSAFVCFAFNIGLHGFAGSSALRDANNEDYDDVPAAMLLWNKTTVNGHLVVSNGLTVRRQAEIALWNTAADEPAQAPPSHGYA